MFRYCSCYYYHFIQMPTYINTIETFISLSFRLLCFRFHCSRRRAGVVVVVPLYRCRRCRRVIRDWQLLNWNRSFDSLIFFRKTWGMCCFDVVLLLFHRYVKQKKSNQNEKNVIVCNSVEKNKPRVKTQRWHACLF